MTRTLGFLALALIGCQTVPPPPPAPRTGTAVTAGTHRTWDAVIEVFAERNIPISNMERASGFISTDQLAVDPQSGKAYADCGLIMGMPIPADRATYNVLVRGDSARSTVKVTVRFTQGGRSNDPQLIECSTRGTWETEFEADVKRRAEAVSG